jgi:hypothetical protein
MTVQERAESLIDEAYEFAPSSGAIKEAVAIEIAIWCAENIAANQGFSMNYEYWVDVIKALKSKAVITCA